MVLAAAGLELATHHAAVSGSGGRGGLARRAEALLCGGEVMHITRGSDEPCNACPMRLVVVHVAAGAAQRGSRSCGSRLRSVQRILTEDPLRRGTSPGPPHSRSVGERESVTSAGRSRPAPRRRMTRTRWASPRHAPCASRARRARPRHAEVRSPGPPWTRMPCQPRRSGRGAVS